MRRRGLLALALAVALGLTTAGPVRAADPEPGIEARDERGATALIRAVQSDQIEQVRALLEQGARIDAVAPPGRAILPYWKSDFGPNQHRW